MLPAVSVVLPCPQAAAPPALEAILAQEGVELEVWLVGAEAPAHPDVRVHPLRSPELLDLAAAWRAGLGRAGGDLVSLCHPDALWRTTEHLRDAAEALSAHRADLYCGDSTAQRGNLDRRQHPRRQEHPLVVELQLRRALSSGWFPTLSSAVIRVGALEDPLADHETWPAGWDILFGALDRCARRLYRPALLVQHAERPPADPLSAALKNAAAAAHLKRSCRHRRMRAEAARREASYLEQASHLAADRGAVKDALRHAAAALIADPELSRVPALGARLLGRLRP